MKLLLDENLSRRLVPFLQQTYPDSSQVVLLDLQAATDLEIWDFAKSQGYVVVTRDADFLDLSLLKGQPPKIVRLRTPNQGRAATLNLLLSKQLLIEQVLMKDNEAYVEILPAKNSEVLL
jgi:predicted nuclease of predicted toxin-antitoxin system